MNDDAQKLARTARQLLDTDAALGGSYLPAERNPLPSPAPATPEKAGPAPPATSPRSPDAEEKAAALDRIYTQEARDCEKCGLSRGRNKVVFGEGNSDADLVFVGEGPGQEEDRTGHPFVGRAGDLLTKMIGAMGLRREDVYICNVVKCRPPGNRAPTPDEAAACWSYLVRQLEIIRPRVIVTLGNPATRALLNTREGITRLRGRWQQLGMIGEGLAGTAVMPTFHPAFLLRQYTQDNRGKVWSDLQQVMAELGLATPKRGEG